MRFRTTDVVVPGSMPKDVEPPVPANASDTWHQLIKGDFMTWQEMLSKPQYTSPNSHPATNLRTCPHAMGHMFDDDLLCRWCRCPMRSHRKHQYPCRGEH